MVVHCPFCAFHEDECRVLGRTGTECGAHIGMCRL